MAAADVLDALLSERQYKPAFTLEETLKIIEDSRDKHFESCIVDAVLDSKQEIEKILKSK
jgi:HD-GYP domain-containing protein (c-di-GMP phosphodiesterase class II)